MDCREAWHDFDLCFWLNMRVFVCYIYNIQSTLWMETNCMNKESNVGWMWSRCSSDQMFPLTGAVDALQQRQEPLTWPDPQKIVRADNEALPEAEAGTKVRAALFVLWLRNQDGSRRFSWVSSDWNDHTDTEKSESGSTAAAILDWQVKIAARINLPLQRVACFPRWYKYFRKVNAVTISC